MPRFVAFLRAINVGGHTVTMEKLRGHFAALGYGDVETFIASGNVIFTTRSANVASLEKKIAGSLEAALGYEVATFLRTVQEVAAIAAYQAFPASRVRQAGAFCVGFLARPLDAAAQKALTGLKSEIDDFRTYDREVYWLCKTQQHESKFGNVAFEKATKAKITFRNAATVAKLAAKTGASP